VSVRYRHRERRLARTAARIEAARRAIAEQTTGASGHDTWWRRHRATLDEWRHAIAVRHERVPLTAVTAAAGRFVRWTSMLRWRPRLLRLRVECWWLARRLGAHPGERGPFDNLRSGPDA
jgi:hypothetical protein